MDDQKVVLTVGKKVLLMVGKLDVLMAVDWESKKVAQLVQSWVVWKAY
jgi:hypothetical protein